MTTISSANSNATSGLNLTSLDPSLALPTTSTATGSSALTQANFLKLMTTELQNQDPTSPQDPSQMLTQLAQISEVSGISDINTAVGNLTTATMANQAIQAASIVGHVVLSPGSTENLATGKTFTGAIKLPVAASNAFVQIYDTSGALVNQISLGSQSAGIAQFTWDGTNASGVQMPPGTYTLKAGYGSGQQITAASTYVASQVTSVTLGAAGQQTQLNTDQGTQIALADVAAIM